MVYVLLRFDHILSTIILKTFGILEFHPKLRSNQSLHVYSQNIYLTLISYHLLLYVSMKSDLESPSLARKLAAPSLRDVGRAPALPVVAVPAFPSPLSLPPAYPTHQ